MYRGPRLINSLQVHQQYARKQLSNGTFSYNFKLPASSAKVPAAKRKEKTHKFYGMNPELPQIIPDFNPENELIFDSNFESGNLDMAYRVS